MSIQTRQSTVARIRRELASLEKQLADQTKREVDKTKQITQIESSITRTTSLSTLQSKQRQVTRLADEMSRIQSRKADVSKKIAHKTEQLHRAQQDLLKEEARERKRVEEGQKRLERERRDYDRVLTGALQAQERLTTATLEVVDAPRSAKTYDLFICHASEDKDFVGPLAEALQTLGLSVWYDDFQLKVGDSLRRSIDHGLANSRYGLVVFSSAFFAKEWPQYELDGLVEREMTGSKVVLPVWHKVSKDEVRSHSPSLADKVALNSSLLSIEEIAQRMVDVVQGT